MKSRGTITAVGVTLTVLAGIPLCILLLMIAALLASANDTYFTKFGAVGAFIEYNEFSCSKKFPLHVRFENKSVGTVSNIGFALSARYQDRSTNLVKSTTSIADAYRGDGYSAGWSSDRIVESFDDVGMCYQLPQLYDSSAIPKELIWEIKVTYVNFLK